MSLVLCPTINCKQVTRVHTNATKSKGERERERVSERESERVRESERERKKERIEPSIAIAFSTHRVHRRQENSRRGRKCARSNCSESCSDVQNIPFCIDYSILFHNSYSWMEKFDEMLIWSKSTSLNLMITHTYTVQIIEWKGRKKTE